MNETTDYVTYREHITAKEEAQKRMAALEIQLATMHAALMGVPDKLDKLAEAVAALASNKQQNSAPDHTLLAIQRTLDVLSKQQQSPHSNVRDLIELMNTKGNSAGGLKTGLAVGALSVVAALLGWLVLVG